MACKVSGGVEVWKRSGQVPPLMLPEGRRPAARLPLTHAAVIMVRETRTLRVAHAFTRPEGRCPAARHRLTHGRNNGARDARRSRSHAFGSRSINFADPITTILLHYVLIMFLKRRAAVVSPAMAAAAGFAADAMEREPWREARPVSCMTTGGYAGIGPHASAGASVLLYIRSILQQNADVYRPGSTRIFGDAGSVSRDSTIWAVGLNSTG